MTKPMRVSKAKAPVREGLTLTEFLDSSNLAGSISSTLERSEVVIAAEGIVDKLQGMAEDLSTIEAKDIMPLMDSLTNSFGPDVAQNFNTVATEQIRQLISAVQTAKTAMDGEIMRLKKGVEGGEMTDLSMDAAKPMMPGAAPAEPPVPGAPGAPGAPGEAPPPEGGLPDMAGNAEDDSLAMGGGFAGREKKEGMPPPPMESTRRKGQRIAEDMPQPHSHESHNLDPNLSGLHMFHGGAGRLAEQIRNMIRTEELGLDQRKGLAEVLSHMAAFAHEPAHWSGVDADNKLQMFLQSANIWKTDTPALQKIVGQLKRLAHLLSLQHDQMLESNISLLRKAANPDAIILQMFRTKLAEQQDGQMAAIRTARAFAIDVEDVVAVVKEAAARRPFRPTKLSEFKADINPAKKGMFKGKDIADLKKMRTNLKKRSEAAQEDGGHVPADVATKEREVNYAIRAKRHWKGGVKEDGPPLMQGVPMFPIEQGSAVTAAAPNMTDQQAQPLPSNQSASTNKPLSPADMHARQNAQVNAQLQQDAIVTGVQGQQQKQPPQPQEHPQAQPHPQAQQQPTQQPQAQGQSQKKQQTSDQLRNSPAMKRAFVK